MSNYISLFPFMIVGFENLETVIRCNDKGFGLHFALKKN